MRLPAETNALVRLWTRILSLHRLVYFLRIDMSMEVVVDGAKFQLQRPSDVAVLKRVLAHFQRRIAEDDWRLLTANKMQSKRGSVWEGYAFK